MWPFFSRDTSKEFPYAFDSSGSSHNVGCFSLRKATHKVTNEDVSVFCYYKKDGTNDQLDYVKSTLKRLKTLRHPNILTYLDSQETDTHIFIATEFVLPLREYLANMESGKGKQWYLSWGLLSIIKALTFLYNDAKLLHNDVGTGAVFVNGAGEWKLGGVGKVREIAQMSSESNPPWASDSLGFGTLLWETYNNSECESLGQLSDISKIPSDIKQIYLDLVSRQPTKRPSPVTVLERGRKAGGYFQNDLVDAIVFLDEIHIKNKEEINLFFRNIQPLLKNIPKCTAEFKILPQIIWAHGYGCDGYCLLPPLFDIANHVSDKHFQSEIVPFIVKMYGSNDRATRSMLLTNMEQYVAKIPSNVVNESIFPQILNGFLDTNPRIREQTIKAIVHVAPKLTEKNLGNELMTHLARLLAKDDQGGIRTNTIVCLSKIGYCIPPDSRRSILLSAFLRSLNDPFPPVRNAGVLGMAVSQQYFALEDISKRILPSLCSLTLDPDTSVRENVFKSIKGFLSNLEKVSENPDLKEQMEAEVMSSRKPTKSWAEWATSAITAKLNYKIERNAETETNIDSEKKKEDENSTLQPSKESNKPLSTERSKMMPLSTERPKMMPLADNLFDDATSNDTICDKMKYTVESSDDLISWGGDDTWEALEDGGVTPQDLPVNISEPVRTVPTKHNLKSQIKSEPEKRKPRSGPMKLGTKMTQAKYE